MEYRKVSRFVLDQDTGSAIKNSGRVDYFRDFQIKKYTTFSCGAGVPPATDKERARTPVPQDWIIYFLEVPYGKWSHLADRAGVTGGNGELYYLLL